MTKAILLSIQSLHLYNILKKSKSLELRKSIPKDFVGWVYLYCTKAKPYLSEEQEITFEEIENPPKQYFLDNDKKEFTEGFTKLLNGKVVARFWYDEYTKLKRGRWVNHKVGDWNYRGYMDEHIKTFKKLCLTEKQIEDYGNGKTLYAWHIKKLEIFETPKELSEFYKIPKPIAGYSKEYIVTVVDYMLENATEEERNTFKVKRAPQSYQFVYIKEEDNE